MSDTIISIKNLHASVENTTILRGVDLTMEQGEIHALMGPNGSGKSTLAQIIMGHPSYLVSSGSIDFYASGNRSLASSNILELDPDERSRAGIFLAFQYPVAIPGVPVLSFLRTAYNARHPEQKITVAKFRKILSEHAEKLKIDLDFINRAVNDGFSGGEKKKLEMLQMSVLEPRFIILDETDSGLDVDALQIVGEAVNTYKENNPDVGILIITHYQRILRYIKPDHVHVMKEGKIVESGDSGLAEKLEKEGYKDLR